MSRSLASACIQGHLPESRLGKINMISRSKILTDKEKKLQSLRQQLYGKEPTVQLPNHSESNSAFSFKSTSEPLTNQKVIELLSTESNYLKKDLTKIFVLATIALLSQLAIYFSLNQELLKF